MSKIVERTDEILSMLQKDFEGMQPKIYFNKCYDPIRYLQTWNSVEFPLVLVSYKGNLSNDKNLYPGVCNFEIYFIDIKLKAEELLDLMESVYDLFENNTIHTGRKMIYQDQNYYAESNEHVIYVQRYNILIL
jgi:hypothetical protein